MVKKLTIYLDVKLQISASHVTRYNSLNQLNGNQLVTIVARTSDIVCVSIKYLSTQIPTSICLSSNIISYIDLSYLTVQHVDKTVLLRPILLLFLKLLLG